MTAQPRRTTTRAARALFAAAFAFGLSACAGDDDALVDDARPAEEIFAAAEAASAEGDHVEAATLYDDLERLYPYSTLARTAMIRSAQENYQARRYDEARLAAERFLQFHPADPQAAEAQYIIALSHYDQIVDVGRDQKETRDALAALREVVNRYPDSEYARASRLKLDLANDHLAGKEMEIGRFYLKNGHHVAAISRFRTVIEDYQTTSHTPEALHRLVEAYLALGVTREAQAAAAVLGHNFPGSEWYASSYDLLTGSNLAPADQPDGWIARAYRQVVRGEWL
jgi:outer membrane protein assembly factor BamD